jgi:hypothetical protein
MRNHVATIKQDQPLQGINNSWFLSGTGTFYLEGEKALAVHITVLTGNEQNKIKKPDIYREGNYGAVHAELTHDDLPVFPLGGHLISRPHLAVKQMYQ